MPDTIHQGTPREVVTTVSVTELGSFRECRRAWYLGDYLMYEPKTKSPRFWFGTLIHTALEAYYNNGRELEFAIAAFTEAYDSSIAEEKVSWGFLWDGIKEEFESHLPLGIEMLKNYASMDRAGPRWETIATEQRVWVPIRTPRGRWAWGRPRLTARMDLLAVEEGDDDVSVVDHKSAAQKPSEGRSLDIDDQLTGYAYVYWRLTGELPRKMIYNVLIKATPGEPRVISVTEKNPDGKLSHAKDQKTTFGLYLQAIEERGEDPREYTDILESLKAEGWSDYFSRTSTTRNLDQVKAYEEHLYFTWRDMTAVIRDPRKAYPSPSPIHCPSCPFLSVCQAMEDGGDHQGLLDRNYQKQKEKRW